MSNWVHSDYTQNNESCKEIAFKVVILQNTEVAFIIHILRRVIFVVILHKSKSNGQNILYTKFDYTCDPIPLRFLMATLNNVMSVLWMYLSTDNWISK